MYKEDKKILQDFQKSRNLTNNTLHGYTTTLKLYITIQGKPFHRLLKEAEKEEIQGVRWKDRTLKQRLIQFRTYLIEKDYYEKTIKEYMNRIRTLYRHNEIELHPLPPVSDRNLNRPAPVTYSDLPDKELIRKVLDISTPIQKAMVLFMCSTGCAKKETLNVTIQDFIDATKDYHNSSDIYEVIKLLDSHDNIIPTFRIHRKKTNKHYITFASPEATTAIINYLINRKDRLTPDKKLFKINDKYLNEQFGEINRKLNLGNVGKYRKFRTHMLRKWHASMLANDGMSRDDVNDLQGKAKNSTDSSYFFEDPEKLKEKYIQHLDAVTVTIDVSSLDFKSPEYMQMEQELESKESQLKDYESELQNINSKIDGLEKILTDLNIDEIVDQVRKT